MSKEVNLNTVQQESGLATHAAKLVKGRMGDHADEARDRIKRTGLTQGVLTTGIPIESINFNHRDNYRWSMLPDEAAFKAYISTGVVASELTTIRQSIEVGGVRNPVGLIGPDENGQYGVIYGFRRVWSVLELGGKVPTIDAYVYPPTMEPLEITVLQTAENGENLTAAVPHGQLVRQMKALVYASGGESSSGFAKIAKLTGYAKATVMRYIREYDNVNAGVRDALNSGAMSADTAKLFYNPDKDAVDPLYDDAKVTAVLSLALESAPDGKITKGALTKAFQTFQDANESAPEGEGCKATGPRLTERFTMLSGRTAMVNLLQSLLPDEGIAFEAGAGKEGQAQKAMLSTFHKSPEAWAAAGQAIQCGKLTLAPITFREDTDHYRRHICIEAIAANFLTATEPKIQVTNPRDKSKNVKLWVEHFILESGVKVTNKARVDRVINDYANTRDKDFSDTCYAFVRALDELIDGNVEHRATRRRRIASNKEKEQTRKERSAARKAEKEDA